MLGKTRWSNRPGSFSFEFGKDDNGKYVFASNDKPVPEDIVQAIVALFPEDDNDWFEVIINFRSSGYYDPGKTYGDPYYCYPPEGEDERTLDYAEVGDQKLPENIGQKLFDLFEDAIYEEEVDNGPDEPDYEPDYDDYDYPDYDDDKSLYFEP